MPPRLRKQNPIHSGTLPTSLSETPLHSEPPQETVIPSALALDLLLIQLRPLLDLELYSSGGLNSVVGREKEPGVFELRTVSEKNVVR